MKILMLTGDKRVFEEGTDAHARFVLQQRKVEELRAVYWGRGALSIPSAQGFDVVTVQDPFWRGIAGLLAARRAKSKFNVQVHTDVDAQSFFKWMVSRFVLRRADSVRVVSEKIQRQVEAIGVHAHISILPVFIDIDAVRAAPVLPLREQYPQFKKLLLVASRLEPEKNVSMALHAMPEILKTVPDAGLLIAGSGTQKEELQALTKNLSIENRVIFVGFRKDIYSLYKGVDVVLQPSWYEGFGASIVEALAAGTPVISFDVGIAREAGASIATQEDFARKAAEVLMQNTKGQLHLSVLSKEAWGNAWLNTL